MQNGHHSMPFKICALKNEQVIILIRNRHHHHHHHHHYTICGERMRRMATYEDLLKTTS